MNYRLNIVEKKELNEDQKEKLAGFLKSTYAGLDNERAAQKTDAKILKDLIDRDSISEIKFDTKINPDDLYELRESQKAVIMKYLDSSIENFTVTGEDQTSFDNAAIQKENLINIIRKIKLKDTYEKIVDNFQVWGEFVSFADYYTEEEEIRRPRDFIQKNIIEPLKAKNPQEAIALEEMISNEQFVNQNFFNLKRTLYDGARIRDVDSENFVYNKDRTLKLWKWKADYGDIVNNKNYEISETLKQEIEKAEESANKDKENEKPIEIVECWGNITFRYNNERINLHNYIVVVANDKHIIRCEPNPYVQDPFCLKAPIKYYKSGRGRSPLNVAVVHSLLSGYVLTQVVNAFEFKKDPAWIGSKAEDAGEIHAKPGMVMDVQEIFNGEMPKEYTPSDSVFTAGERLQERLKATAQSTTGIYPYMSGIMDNSRTATESTYLAMGQQDRAMRILDSFQDFQLENLKKIAGMEANFKTGTESFVKTGDSFEETPITSEIRGGNYIYNYSDRRSWVEKQQAEEKYLAGYFNFLKAGAKGNIQFEFEEWLKTQEKKNIEKRMQSDELEEILKTLPPEEQTVIKQGLANMVKQGIQEYDGQIQNPMQPNGNPDIEQGMANI